MPCDAIAGRSWEGDGVDWQVILNAALRVVGWMYECGEKIAARGTSKVTQQPLLSGELCSSDKAKLRGWHNAM